MRSKLAESFRPYLCEYLGINPREFFDDRKTSLKQMREIEAIYEMSEKDVALLLEIIEKLNLYGTSKR